MIALLGAGIAAVSGLIGQLIAGKSREEADAILQSVRDEFGRISPAKVKALAVEQLGPSALDALNRGDEMNTMQDGVNRMTTGIEQGGMTLQDRAALNEALDQAGQQDRAGRAAVTRQFSGTGNQGLVAGLVAQQGSAQNAYRTGNASAGDAQRRYWDMIQSRGGMANQMYANKSRAAEAQDAIARWNATNRQQTAQYNNSLEQQRFDNDLRITNGKMGVAQQQAALKRGDADRTQQTWGGVGAAGAEAAAQAGSDREYEEWKKTRGQRTYGT